MCEVAPPNHTLSHVSLSAPLSLNSSPVHRFVLKFMLQTTDWLLSCRILARRSFVLYCLCNASTVFFFPCYCDCVLFLHVATQYSHQQHSDWVVPAVSALSSTESIVKTEIAQHSNVDLMCLQGSQIWQLDYSTRGFSQEYNSFTG